MEGTCRFCGQVVLIPDGEGLTQDELDREAAKLCTCQQGQQERKILTMIDQGREIVEETVKPESTRAAGILQDGIEAVCRGYIKRVTVTINDRVTARMQLSKNGIYIGCRETTEKGGEGTGV